MSEQEGLTQTEIFLIRKLADPLDRNEKCCMIFRYFKECICLKSDFPDCKAECPPESAWKPLDEVLFHRAGKSFCLYDNAHKVWREVSCLTLCSFLIDYLWRREE